MIHASFSRGVLTTAFLLMSLFGCERKPAPPNTPKLRVGYIPIAECAHLYVGIAKGMFANEDIQVELVPMKGGASILPAVQSGDLDIGFSNVVSLILLNSRLPEKDSKSLISLVGATLERPGFSNHALLTKSTAQLTIENLGQSSTRIGLNTTRNIEELMLRRFLVAHKVNEATLNLVPMGFPQMLSAVDRNEIDVASVVEPFIEPALRSGKYKLLARQYLAVSDTTLVATYAVSRGWLDKHADIAVRLGRAFRKASDFVKSNDAEARNIIGSFTDIRQEDLPIIGMAAYESRVPVAAAQDLIDQMLRFDFIDSRLDPNTLIAPVKD